MENSKRDFILARLLILASLVILLPWLWSGLVWMWHWYQGYATPDANPWTDLGAFLLKNLSVVIIIYSIIGLQVAGIAEFKYNKNFLPAFLLALVITPPLMLVVYGRRKRG